MEIDPNNPSPYYNLGCISSMRGNVEEALEYVKKCLEIYPAYREQMLDDKDFNNIKDLEKFKKLIDKYK